MFWLFGRVKGEILKVNQLCFTFGQKCSMWRKLKLKSNRCGRSEVRLLGVWTIEWNKELLLKSYSSSLSISTGNHSYCWVITCSGHWKLVAIPAGAWYVELTMQEEDRSRIITWDLEWLPLRLQIWSLLLGPSWENRTTTTMCNRGTWI